MKRIFSSTPFVPLHWLAPKSNFLTTSCKKQAEVNWLIDRVQYSQDWPTIYCESKNEDKDTSHLAFERFNSRPHSLSYADYFLGHLLASLFINTHLKTDLTGQNK